MGAFVCAALPFDAAQLDAQICDRQSLGSRHVEPSVLLVWIERRHDGMMTSGQVITTS